uniref:Uncharacterized protein n=1 Tax=Medicago truncatula TaxID=3880 RepID=A2Q1U3_MEDTR|nr:hypothetical protein MtrDRAFT_AC149129g7v2 [Medicago truncatula]
MTHVDGCLWYKVLVARYSEEDGQINEGGSLGSVWWKDLRSIQSCVGSGVDNWFKDKLIQVVGWHGGHIERIFRAGQRLYS